MTFKVLNQAQMLFLCYGSQPLPKQYYKVFKYLDFSRDLLQYGTNNKFAIAIESHRVVGIVKIMAQDNESWLSYVSVHPDAKRKGVAKSLLNFTFETFKDKPLLLSRYSEEGLQYLKPFIDKKQKQYKNIYFNEQ